MYNYRIVKRYRPESTVSYFIVQKRTLLFFWMSWDSGYWVISGQGERYYSEDDAAKEIGRLMEHDKVQEERRRLIKESPKVVRYF